MENDQVERPESAPEENTSEVKQETPSMEDLVERLNQLEEKNSQLLSTNERLLSESKSNKMKYQEVKRNMEDAKLQEAKEAEDKSEYIKQIEEKLNGAIQELQAERKANASEKLKYAVAKVAKEAHDVDDIVSKLDFNELEYDKETRTWMGVDAQVERVKKEKPYLFDYGRTANMTNGLNNKPMVNGPKTMSDLSEAEKNELLALKMKGL